MIDKEEMRRQAIEAADEAVIEAQIAGVTQRAERVTMIVATVVFIVVVLIFVGPVLPSGNKWLWLVVLPFVVIRQIGKAVGLYAEGLARERIAKR